MLISKAVEGKSIEKVFKSKLYKAKNINFIKL